MPNKVRINKLNAYFIVLLIILTSCSNDFKFKYIKSKQIKNNLYVEIYYDGETVYHLLTDSTNFSEYVGVTDPERGETIDIKIEGDRICIFKKSKLPFCKNFVFAQNDELSLNKLKNEKKNNRNYQLY